VALLPHDRTQEQREKGLGESACLNIRTSWFAAGAGGSGLRPATDFLGKCHGGFQPVRHRGSNEMLDLLLFAYVTRCLLEFRVDRGGSWLIRGTFVYGAAITNNWAMIGFLPLFLVALVWLKGLGFFNPRFPDPAWFERSGGATVLLAAAAGAKPLRQRHDPILAGVEGESQQPKEYSVAALQGHAAGPNLVGLSVSVAADFHH